MPSPSKINATPVDKTKTNSETQAIFDLFIINGMELIYDENQAKTMLPRLSSGDDPTKTMAELLVDIITRIIESAQDAGKKIPPEVVLHGGNFLFAELLKVLEAAGMEPLTEEQKTSVWQMASSIYIDQAISSGQMSKQELIALSKEAEQTDEGKKVIKTADNPEAAIKDLKQPTREQEQIQPQADPAALAAPNQGGI